MKYSYKIANPHDDGNTTLIVQGFIFENEPTFSYNDDDPDVNIEIRRIGQVTIGAEVEDVTEQYEGDELEPIVDSVREMYIRRTGRYVNR